MRNVALLLSLTVAGASVAGAQTIPGLPSTADCQAAADSLSHSVHATETWDVLIACPAQAPAAVSSAIAAAHAETDTVYLSSLVGLASRVQTPGVLTAALQLNRDKTAPLAARIASLEILLKQYSVGLTLQPLNTSWANLLSIPRGTNCRTTGLGSGEYVATATMPADFATQIAWRADSIANDVTESQVLRDLAACVRKSTLDSVPNLVASSALTMTYVCGTKFKVHNASSAWASLTYDVQGTSEQGGLQAAPNADTTLFTTATGSARLYLNGQLIQTVTNAQTTCP